VNHVNPGSDILKILIQTIMIVSLTR